MGVTVYTAPAPLIDLSEVKQHLRVEVVDDDGLIQALLSACTRHAEEILEQSFVTQTLTWTLDYWEDERYADSDGVLMVPRAPLVSVTHCKYYDADDVQQTLSTDYYQVDASEYPGRIGFTDGLALPTLSTRLAPIEFRIVTGYGAASTVPKQAVAAVKMMVGNMYYHREVLPEHGAEMALLNSMRHHGYK